MAANPSSHLQHSSISSFHSGGNEQAILAATVQKIAHHAVELLHLDECAVAVLDDAGANLVLLASSRNVLEAPQPAFPLDQEPLAACLAQRETLILRDARLDACLQPLGEGASCVLACLPVLEREQVVGVLLASAQHDLAPEQLRLLALLAEQAALATSNARQAETVRDANRMKANFLSLVTHELRSPLNTINGYLDLILEGIAGEINEQQQEFIRRARSSSEHLYALLEDLLLASRADAGQLRLNCAPTSLHELVASAIEELEVTALDGQVTLESELPADLPLLLVDSVRLQQVLRNLLINALRFTPADGRVVVGARVLPAQAEGEPELAEITVRDTGVGIAPEYHERIFERFFQVPRSEGGRTSGQGLGLTIARMIVELHHGQIGVESSPGAGSTFRFTLPLT